MEEKIGSAGSLVGAALETAGHYLQSEMLNLLVTSDASRTLGALLYILAAISAVFTVAIGGRYKYGLWFLFAPGIFLWLINDTVPSRGANWQFGNEVYDEEHIAKATEGTLSDSDGGSIEGVSKAVNISKFFAKWNQVTSGTVQAFINVLPTNELKSNLTFINKTERYEALFRQDLMDPKLKLFVNIALVDKCGDYFSLLRYAYNPALEGTPLQAQARDRLIEIETQARFNLRSYPELVRWLEGSGYIAARGLFGSTVDIEKYLTRNEMMSCGELWNLAVELFKIHANEIIDLLSTSDLPPGVTSAEMRLKLEKKFGAFNPEFVGPVDFLTDLSDNEKTLAMINEVAVRMLLRQFSEINPSLAQLGVGQHMQVYTEGENDTYGDMARSIRQMNEREEFQGKGDFLSAMLTLPYIQGLALYFLSATFPLFALVLLLPGRYGGFFKWMGLWLWIKSWDLGVAFVMFLDEILYTLMPHGPALLDDAAGGNESIVSMANKSDVIKAVLSVDPMYSVHMYYNLIATCIAAIPVLSYVLVKKGGDEVAGAIKQGFHGFSGRIGTAMASYQASMIAQGKSSMVEQNTYNAIDKAFNRAVFNNPSVRASFGEFISTRTFGGMMQRWQRDSRGNASDYINKLVNQTGMHLSDYNQRTLLNDIAGHLHAAAYQESMSYENRRRAADAVMVKHYSHPFNLTPPEGAVKGALLEHYNFKLGALSKGAGDRFADAALDYVPNATKPKVN